MIAMATENRQHLSDHAKVMNYAEEGWREVREKLNFGDTVKLIEVINCTASKLVEPKCQGGKSEAAWFRRTFLAHELEMEKETHARKQNYSRHLALFLRRLAITLLESGHIDNGLELIRLAEMISPVGV